MCIVRSAENLSQKEREVAICWIIWGDIFIVAAVENFTTLRIPSKLPRITEVENMTNDQIIQEETKRLRQLGKIGKHEEINTYDFWKNLGMTPRQEAPITRLKMKNSMGYYCWKSFWSTSQISC